MPRKIGYGDLTAMDGEPHADQGGGEGDDDEHEKLGEQSEEADHRKIRLDGCGAVGQVTRRVQAYSRAHVAHPQFTEGVKR